MFYVYVTYKGTTKRVDFYDKNKAIQYAERIVSKGKALKVIVEDVNRCMIVYKKYAEI